MESLAKAIETMVLSILFSAGIPVGDDLSRDILRECWRKMKDASPEDMRRAALDVLEAVAYPADRETGCVQGYPLIMRGGHGKPALDRPDIGHLVRLSRDWHEVEAGQLLMLSGVRGSGRHCIGRGRHYWGMDLETGEDDNIVSLSSGGPASIAYADPAGMTPTGEYAPASFWRFRSTPRAHSGVDFQRLMPVWSWNGAFLDFDTIAA